MQSVQLLKLCMQFVLYLCEAMLFSFHTASHDCKPTPAYILQRGRNSRCLIHSLPVKLLNQRFTQRLVWNPAVIAIPLFLLRVGTLHLFRMQGWSREAPYSWLLIIPCCSSSCTRALRLALTPFTKTFLLDLSFRDLSKTSCALGQFQLTAWVVSLVWDKR